jgi:hypothetical protein
LNFQNIIIQFWHQSSNILFLIAGKLKVNNPSVDPYTISHLYIRPPLTYSFPGKGSQKEKNIVLY